MGEGEDEPTSSPFMDGFKYAARLLVQSSDKDDAMRKMADILRKTQKEEA